MKIMTTEDGKVLEFTMVVDVDPICCALCGVRLGWFDNGLLGIAPTCACSGCTGE